MMRTGIEEGGAIEIHEVELPLGKVSVGRLHERLQPLQQVANTLALRDHKEEGNAVVVKHIL